MVAKPLGWSVFDAYCKASLTFESKINEHYVWINEAIEEARNTFNEYVIVLFTSPYLKRSNKLITSVNAGYAYVNNVAIVASIYWSQFIINLSLVIHFKLFLFCVPVCLTNRFICKLFM